MSELLLREHLSKKFDLPEAVPFGRAAAGIAATLAVWSAGRKGVKVALPAMACHDLLAAVISSGCEPIFCDIRLEDGLVEMATWQEAIDSGASVILLVHSFGNAADGTRLRLLCDAAGVLLIDDAAQALGSTHEGVLAGSCGHVGVLSFGQTKHVDVAGAVLLYQDRQLAIDAATYAKSRPIAESGVRNRVIQIFRKKYFSARAELSQLRENSTTLFRGLLEGYEPALWLNWKPECSVKILERLGDYENDAAERCRKAKLWESNLASCGVVPVGMRKGCVPWRYTCRLPGIGWAEQQAMSERVREGGTDISNWYTPLPWFINQSIGGAPLQSIQLANEVFQFWVCPATSDQDIKRGSENFRMAVEKTRLAKISRPG